MHLAMGMRGGNNVGALKRSINCSRNDPTQQGNADCCTKRHRSSFVFTLKMRSKQATGARRADF